MGDRFRFSTASIIDQVGAAVSRISLRSNTEISERLTEGVPARLAYGISDAASALDLSRSRIYELISSGEIATCKIGKRTIIPAAELTAFLDRHRVPRLSTELGVSPSQRHSSRTRAVR